MPLISIIVPVYKVENYIHRCVDSILNQTFRDFELILVDDGSPDGCGAICDSYAAQDSRVRVIHKENGGLSSARNAGMEIARGKYFLFCDSDDYVVPDWCELFLKNVTPEENNYIFGGICTVYVTESGEKMVPPNVPEQLCWEVADYLSLQSRGILGFACNVLYYADILRKYNLRFSEDIIVEDLPFNLSYVRYMKELTYTGQAGYFYIQDCRETLSRKYYPESFRRWQEKYRVSQDFITECLPQEKQEENRHIVADKYLYPFLQVLNNTFDPRNPKSLPDKIKYNIYVVQTDDFQHCLRYADASREDPRVIRLLKKKNYIAVFLLQTAFRFKQRLLERRK